MRSIMAQILCMGRAKVIFGTHCMFHKKNACSVNFKLMLATYRTYRWSFGVVLYEIVTIGE